MHRTLDVFDRVFAHIHEVIDAVREHVRNAIGRVAPERFSQEANYTAALASQLEGTAYVGEHGSVVFKSTVFDDRGPSSAEHQFGADTGH